VQVFTEDELIRLSKTCNGKTFIDRRDKAIIELFKATGIRLSEMASITYDPDHPERADLNMEDREVLIHGKGRKEPLVKFTYDAARAIDRYLRVRGKHAHAHAHSHSLWLGVNNRAPHDRERHLSDDRPPWRGLRRLRPPPQVPPPLLAHAARQGRQRG
jgi:site-specific recombinase XerC